MFVIVCTLLIHYILQYGHWVIQDTCISEGKLMDRRLLNYERILNIKNIDCWCTSVGRRDTIDYNLDILSSHYEFLQTQIPNYGTKSGKKKLYKTSTFYVTLLHRFQVLIKYVLLRSLSADDQKKRAVI